MNTFFDSKNAMRMGRLLILAVLFIALYMMAKFVGELQKLGSAGEDMTKISTVDVSGEGSAFAVPDIANESFTVAQKAATIAEAQTTVTQKANDAIAFLKKSGVADADIQTTDYSAYPEYNSPTPCAPGLFCPADSTANGPQKIVDYSVSETVTVKIRDTGAVGKIVEGLGSLGVTGLSGPNFTVDNPDTVIAEARKKAIDDAKAKADILAKDLGVRFVRIVRFSENNGGIYPVMMSAKASGVGMDTPAPEIAPGQNKYTSDVTITYEIQ